MYTATNPSQVRSEFHFTSCQKNVVTSCRTRYAAGDGFHHTKARGQSEITRLDAYAQGLVQTDYCQDETIAGQAQGGRFCHGHTYLPGRLKKPPMRNQDWIDPQFLRLAGNCCQYSDLSVVCERLQVRSRTPTCPAGPRPRGMGELFIARSFPVGSTRATTETVPPFKSTRKVRRTLLACKSARPLLLRLFYVATPSCPRPLQIF